jgi:hypothetical protein
MMIPYAAMMSLFAVKAPVLGLYFSLVEETVNGKLPVVVLTNVG